ncbi:MAG: peroxide stress protein YaaA [Verrucomicrobiales bacterium]|nr:peroxide stress protein YaaA [Verrucomicrobiales bacterium]
MLAVLSPAKTLDYESDLPAHRPTQPRFLDQSEELIEVLRKRSRPQLRELMGISEKLADLNFQRNKEWQRPFTEDNARAAILAFKGDVYTGFDLSQYSKEDFSYAQKHLAILSGLYGMLRPLDLMQPYRLEMGTALKNAKGKNLYEFWGNAITREVNKSLKASGSDTLVNLASNEYFKVLQPEDIKGEIITPAFKDLKNGTYKFMSFYGKKARGMMADFIVRERVETPAKLKKFKTEGYRYNAEMSEGNNWVFTRDEVPKTA